MLIFLGFDGVTHAIGAEKPFSGLRLVNIAWALEETDAKIVIASRWRLEHDMDWLIQQLGPDLGPRVIGATPQHADAFARFIRFNEIKDYLATSGDDEPDWLAVDDDRENYPEHAQSQVVVTDYRLGFTNKDARHLRERIKLRTAAMGMRRQG